MIQHMHIVFKQMKKTFNFKRHFFIRSMRFLGDRHMANNNNPQQNIRKQYLMLMLFWAFLYNTIVLLNDCEWTFVAIALVYSSGALINNSFWVVLRRVGRMFQNFLKAKFYILVGFQLPTSLSSFGFSPFILSWARIIVQWSCYWGRWQVSG